MNCPIHALGLDNMELLSADVALDKVLLGDCGIPLGACIIVVLVLPNLSCLRKEDSLLFSPLLW